MKLPRSNKSKLALAIIVVLMILFGIGVYYLFFYQSSTLTESNRYDTVQFNKGQTFTIKLQTTYWESIDTFNDKTTVKPLNSLHHSPCPGEKGIGTGCGTTERSFIAAAPGEVEIYGSRTICGEDLICAHGEGVIAFTINVRP